MSSEQLATRLSAKARLCIIVTAAAAVLAGLLAVGQLGAGAATLEGEIPATCAVPLPPPLGPNQFVDIPFVATNTPDQAEPGDQVSFTVATDYPEIVATTTFYVDDVTVVYPLPPQVEAVDSITFGTSQGWTPSVVETVIDPAGSFVEIFFDGGPGTSSNPSQLGNLRPTPSVTFNVTLNETDDDYYLTWLVASSQVTHAFTIASNIESACQPDDPNQVLNSVTQVGNPITTTTTSSTTTSTTTTTVAPTTTTTLPPTTPRFTG